MKNYMGHLAFSLSTDVISYLEIIGSDPNFEVPFQFIGAKTGRRIDTEGPTELTEFEFAASAKHGVFGVLLFDSIP